jgi:predicted SAM-dependent methyltransferase
VESVKLDELKQLAADRELKTSEIHGPNDYYGNASVLKRFVGFSQNYATRCVIEHGPFYPTIRWSEDINAPLPVFLRSNRAACQILKAKTKKLVFAIGPVIAYADSHLDTAALAAEKKRLGKNLLIFPPHSTHHIKVRYDNAWLIEHASSMGKAYDSITVCLYWKDIHTEAVYRAAGFECVTCGHIFDPFFLNRQKSFLTLADSVISYTWCSAIGYAVLLGKPLMVLPALGERYEAAESIVARDTAGTREDWEFQTYKQKIISLFSDLNETTPGQYKAIDYMWGLDDVLPKQKLTDILRLGHDMHAIKKKNGLSTFPDALQQGRWYRENNQPGMASLVLEQAMFMGLQSAELLQETAIARVECGTLQKIRKMKLLNLGCGSRLHPEWVNVDFTAAHPSVLVWDLNKGIPFDAHSFDVVYHSHLLEHFPKNRAGFFIRECFHVLKPEGIIRVAVPDLEKIVRWYLHLLEKSLEGDQDAQHKYDWILIELFDQMVRNTSGGEMLNYWCQTPMPAEKFVSNRMGTELAQALRNIKPRRHAPGLNPALTAQNPESIGRFRLSGEIHQWMYDRYSLGKLLSDADFQEITVCSATQSIIPAFNTYGLDVSRDGSIRKPDSLFMEARKKKAV